VDLLDAAQVFVVAMTPVGELRAAIPYGVLELRAPWLPVLLIAIVGNIVPVIVMLPLMNRISALLELRPNPIGRLLQWRVNRLQTVHQERFLRWGAPALILLVALPLPMTGAWTGTLAAWIFKIPFRTAVPIIALGVVMAGILVTLITVTAGAWLLGDGA
jgi:uncharacterized membrane protein